MAQRISGAIVGAGRGQGRLVKVLGQRLILNLLAGLRRGEYPQLLHQIWAVSSIPALDDFAFD